MVSLTSSTLDIIARTNLLYSDCGTVRSAHPESTTSAYLHPLPFTECLAHVEILYNLNNMKILRIRGFLEHNEDCLSARYRNAPRTPLHLDVFEQCLKLLQTGTPLTEIKSRNHYMVQNALYPNIPKSVEGRVQSRYRWVLHDSDTRALYRLFNREQGIDTRTAAHVNVHHWLDPQSPKYNKVFADAVFHYSARAQKNDRFEVCIATSDMKEAAWSYGHKKQIILDGTFGICDRKLLLFIIMGIDETNAGIPLAFLLFSAPSGNGQTSAGYDHMILQKLLQQWRNSLGQQDDAQFAPAVCITDTDIKERKALSIVFSQIILLICRFHVRQSWKNHRTKKLGGDQDLPLRKDLVARMRSLETNLIDTETFSTAKELVAAEETNLKNLITISPDCAILITRALEHLQYFSHYWLGTEALWQSWSKCGRILASAQMSCSIENIVTTTNHLESFNNVLKGKHLQRWKHGGRRLRVDVLLWILVSKITPAIFAQRRAQAEEALILQERWSRLPGGSCIIARRRTRAETRKHRNSGQNLTGSSTLPPVFYCEPDQARDSAAADILSNKQISTPEFLPERNIYLFTCFSSQALASDSSPTVYAIEIHLLGTGSCSCPDFTSRGGACKHLRAALLQLQHIRDTKIPSLPKVRIPISRQQALEEEFPTTHQSGPDFSSDLIDRATSAIADTFAYTDDPFLTSDGLDLANISSQLDASVATSDIPDFDDDAMSSALEDEDEDEDEDEGKDVKPGGQCSQVPNGVDDQTTARVLNELEATLPKLEELGRMLQGIQINKVFETRLTHCQCRLQSVASKLNIVDSDYNDVDELSHAPNNSHSTVPFPSTLLAHNELKRSNDLLPPSPEKSQKRKKSYSHH